MEKIFVAATAWTILSSCLGYNPWDDDLEGLTSADMPVLGLDVSPFAPQSPSNLAPYDQPEYGIESVGPETQQPISSDSPDGRIEQQLAIVVGVPLQADGSNDAPFMNTESQQLDAVPALNGFPYDPIVENSDSDVIGFGSPSQDQPAAQVSYMNEENFGVVSQSRALMDDVQGLLSQLAGDVPDAVTVQKEAAELSSRMAASHEVDRVEEDLVFCDMSRIVNAAWRRTQDYPRLEQLMTPFDSVAVSDLDSLTGHWYQVETSRLQLRTGMSGKRCISYEISLQSGTLSMKLIMRGSQDTDVSAVALPAVLSQSGTLSFSLDALGPCAVDEAWVVELGPIINGFYEWVVLNGPMGLGLAVLARDPTRYVSMYEHDVQVILDGMGSLHPLQAAVSSYSEECDAALEGSKSYADQTSKDDAELWLASTEATLSFDGFATTTMAADVPIASMDTAPPHMAANQKAFTTDVPCGENCSSCMWWIVATGMLSGLVVLLCILLAVCGCRQRQGPKHVAMYAPSGGCAFCGLAKCNHMEDATFPSKPLVKPEVSI